MQKIAEKDEPETKNADTEETPVATEAEASESTEESSEGSAEGAATGKKAKKQKKVVRRRKSKKEKESPLIGAIKLVVESGKVGYGSRSSMRGRARAKLYVLARNTPAAIRSRLLKLAGSEVAVIEFEGSTIALGNVCGCPFPVSVLTVYSTGSSNILELAKN